MNVKYGLAGNLTLDVTINPDIGQGESDPARVNLSVVPSSSRRLISSLRLEISFFHSRRIGSRKVTRRLRGPPDVATIQTAEKLSSKSVSGWTIGLLHASTTEETANVITGDGSERHESIEQMTQYDMARLHLHSNTLAGRFDFRHRFWNDHFQLSGYFLVPHMLGSPSPGCRPCNFRPYAHIVGGLECLHRLLQNRREFLALLR